jgi:pimeloyl-ACP methyl ester carboxylesterase
MKRLIRSVLLFGPLFALSTAAGAQSGMQSGFATSSDGTRIHYVAGGSPPVYHVEPGRSYVRQPAILFVPGWTMPAWIWEQQLDYFGRMHRVVAMDPRSQGESDRPRDGHFPEQRARDIRAVVEHLKLEPVVLVGWSMGVQEVVAYIDQFGTAGLAGVVLVDGIPGGPYDPQMTPMMLNWGAGFLRDRARVTEAFARQSFRNPPSEEYLLRVIEASLSTPTDSAIALLLGSITTDLTPALAKIDRPALITYAPGGPWTAMYQAMRQKIPGSRLEAFDGAGHALFVDQAEKFNAVIEEFLRGLPSPR